VPLSLTKWALLITGQHQRSPKKPFLEQNYVRFYVLLLEVRLGQFSSENAALINLTP
jgi:hypothetical protein